MKKALMIITDGRDYFWPTLDSLREHVGIDQFDQFIILNDSRDPNFEAMLLEIPENPVVYTAPQQRGFTEQIRFGWSKILSDVDYIFHMEDDFVFLEDISIDDMIVVMESHGELQQMALLRGPVNDEERAAGGIIEQHPEDFELVQEGDFKWRSHRRFFTTNPCLYRRSLIDRGWPSVQNSEGIFGYELLNEDFSRRCAFWEDRVLVAHIGHVRSGTGY